MNKYSAISIHPLASSVQRERILLSYQGQYYEANQSIVELVKELQFHETEEEAIAAYTKKKAGKYTPEQVRLIIDKFITPLFTPKPPKRSFLYEKELFSAAAIDKFSDTFRFLFNHWYMLTVFLVAVSLDAWFFFRTPDLLLFGQSFYGILLRICHSDLPVPVCTDLPRRGERTDSLPVEPDDAAVCLAA